MSRAVRVINTLDLTYRGRCWGDECSDGIAPGEVVEVSEEAAAYLISTHGFARVDPPKPARKTRKRGATRGAAPE